MQTIGGYRRMRLTHRTAAFVSVGVLLLASIATQAAVASTADAVVLAKAKTLVVDDDVQEGDQDNQNGDRCGDARFTSIQAAVNKARAGDVVQVCPGVYDERVTVNKPLTIRGDAASVAALDCFAATRPTLDPTQQVIVTATTDNPEKPLFNLQADNIDLQGFVLEGPGSNQEVEPFQHAVATAPDHSGYQVHHNLIMANTVGIFHRSNGVLPSTFDHNCLRENGWGTSNILANGPGHVEPLINARIHDNSAYKTVNVGFEVLTGADGVTVDHNVSDGFTFFGYLFIGTNDTMVYANTARNGGQAGIQVGVQGGNNPPNSSLHLQDNTITGGLTGIPVLPGSLKDSTITGNTVSGVTASGIVLAANNSANTVSENIVTNNGANGIRLVNSTGDNKVTANTIETNGANGIQLSAGTAGNTVSGNTVETNGANGIQFAAGTADNTVSGNTVQGNKANGIQLLGPAGTVAGATTNTVSANTVQGNSLNGILAAAGATANAIRTNQMSGNGTNLTANPLGVDARDDAFDTNKNTWLGNVCGTDFPSGAICGVN